MVSRQSLLFLLTSYGEESAFEQRSIQDLIYGPGRKKGKCHERMRGKK